MRFGEIYSTRRCKSAASSSKNIYLTSIYRLFLRLILASRAYRFFDKVYAELIDSGRTGLGLAKSVANNDQIKKIALPVLLSRIPLVRFRYSNGKQA